MRKLNTMKTKQSANKRWSNKIGNLISLGLILLLLFNPASKAWLLRQMMAMGLFNAKIDKEAPVANVPIGQEPFSFLDQKGNTISEASLKGKVVFITFWATWCPPCRAEMPSLNDLYKQFSKEENIVFLFLNEDSDAAKAKEYLQHNRFAIPLLSGIANMPNEIYSGTLPTTVILNKEGRIVYKHEGLAKYNTKTFIHQLRALL